MNMRQLELALVDSCISFCIGARGGRSVKSLPGLWQKRTVALLSAAVEVIYFHPSMDSYWKSAPEEGLCRKAVAFGFRFALPTVSYLAGVYIGLATEFFEPGRVAP